MAEAEELKGLAVLLASPAGSFITGAATSSTAARRSRLP